MTGIEAAALISGKSRLAAAFARAEAAGRGALIPYLCAGDPDLATTEAIVNAIAPRCDVLEIGIPYGDPLADGPTIAAAAQRALDRGTTIDDALDMIGRCVANGAPPTLAFTYLNPIVQYGLERFAERLVEIGASGAIVPDLPFEESHMVRDVFAPRGLALPLLVAPTTPLERSVVITDASDVFVYIVSRLGVTSAQRGPDLTWIEERVAALRARATGATRMAVGFGISTPSHVREVVVRADAAIVGSALIDAYAGASGAAAVARARDFVERLAEATPRA